MGQPTRRGVLSGAAALLLAPSLPASATPRRKPIENHGVTYDTGTDYGSMMSRDSWHETQVAEELRALRETLKCNAVIVTGTIESRLEHAARTAHSLGMRLWLQPRLYEATAAEQIEHIGRVARLAERLSGEGIDLTFVAGCEVSLFQRGLVPGTGFEDRLGVIFGGERGGPGQYMAEVNAFLRRCLAEVRRHFGGRATYAAGAWETIDWDIFDIVGINLYRDRNNHAVFGEELRRYKATGKPVAITEFGCSTFRGAGAYGGGGFTVVDYSDGRGRIPEAFERDEAEQARELTEQLAIFENEGVFGAFVYTFLSQYLWHDGQDPSRDLDIASHALVKVQPTREGTAPLRWAPKQSFTAVAEVFSRLSST
ncbi:hypothetical protein [Nitratireductor pacificus]|uniref:hypothetical protein n=1 Tax=Nitratireductor pacificus TaxID=1231180 RepID=UPI0012F69896|nr:hypothetical protein [Nitratireductor pacificus]